MSEFTTAEIIDDSKLNQKTKWVGRGNQVALITSPQAGQKGFITRPDTTARTEAGYTYDKHIFRKAANDAWYQKASDETSGTLSTGTVGTTNTAAGDVLNFGVELTLPTTEKFYVITHIEFKAGSTHSFYAGLYVLSNSLSIGDTSQAALVALAQEIAATSGVLYTQPCASKVLRGGQVLVPFVAGQTSSQIRIVDGTSGSDRYYMTETYDNTPEYGKTISVPSPVVGNGRPYIKIYYYGYS